MAETTAPPTVVVSHLDITYRIVGADHHAGDPDDDTAPLGRLLRRGRELGRVREVPAVKDVSFVAHHGESIGIIGRNGSGKSTLLRAVAGLIPPTNGRVWVAGRPSLLGVNAVLMPKLSGARNIHLGCQALGMTREQVDEKFDEIVEFSGIGESVWLPMSTYSSGMGARLRFAISTAVAPDVLMVDEALATGDAEFRARSTARIKQIREDAGTVFLVSHSNSSIREVCTRVLWVDSGRLIADGPTAEVLAAYEATLPKSQRRTAAGPARPEPDVPGVPRWAGATDAETSVLASRATAEPGVDAVVLTDGDPDLVLPVLPPATRWGWPLLVVPGDEVPDVVREELSRLTPKRVVLLGSQDVLAPAVADQVSAAGHPVERWDVGTAGQASARALTEMLTDPPEVLTVATTTQPRRSVPFAVRAARTGEGIVVTDAEALDEELRGVLSQLQVTRTRALGGGGVVSEAILDELGTLLGPVEVIEPAAPSTVYVEAGGALQAEPGTSAVVVPASVTAATLVGAAAAARSGAALLTTLREGLPKETVRALRRLQPGSITLVGARNVATQAVRAALGDLVEKD